MGFKGYLSLQLKLDLSLSWIGLGLRLTKKTPFLSGILLALLNILKKYTLKRQFKKRGPHGLILAAI